MPVSIIDLDGGRGNRISVSGEATMEEIMAAFEAHLTQPAEKFNQYLYSIIDLSDIGRMPINARMIRAIADLCNSAGQRNETISFDAVITTKPWIYGFARMWEAYARNSGWEIKFFKSSEQAIDWLRLRIREQFSIHDLTFA